MQRNNHALGEATMMDRHQGMSGLERQNMRPSVPLTHWEKSLGVWSWTEHVANGFPPPLAPTRRTLLLAPVWLDSSQAFGARSVLELCPGRHMVWWTAGADYAACQSGGLTPLGRLPIRDEKTKTIGFPCRSSPAMLFLPCNLHLPASLEPQWFPTHMPNC